MNWLGLGHGVSNIAMMGIAYWLGTRRRVTPTIPSDPYSALMHAASLLDTAGWSKVSDDVRRSAVAIRTAEAALADSATKAKDE